MSTATAIDATAGFAPDSTYATWSQQEREAADRGEARYNAQRAVERGLAYAGAGHPIREFDGNCLVRFLKRHRRDLEDVECGDLPGGKQRSALLRAKIRDIEREQEFRAGLAASWLASENGTDCYTAFQARGGLAAVRDHGARPPSYELAVLIDEENWKRGAPHVLDWDHHYPTTTYGGPRGGHARLVVPGE